MELKHSTPIFHSFVPLLGNSNKRYAILKCSSTPSSSNYLLQVKMLDFPLLSSKNMGTNWTYFNIYTKYSPVAAPKFLPMPLAVAWVFRLTFFPSPSYSSPSSPHLSLFVSLRYRKRRGGGVGLSLWCNLVWEVTALFSVAIILLRLHKCLFPYEKHGKKFNSHIALKAYIRKQHNNKPKVDNLEQIWTSNETDRFLEEMTDDLLRLPSKWKDSIVYCWLINYCLSN